MRKVLAVLFVIISLMAGGAEPGFTAEIGELHVYFDSCDDFGRISAVDGAWHQYDAWRNKWTDWIHVMSHSMSITERGRGGYCANLSVIFVRTDKARFDQK